MIHLEPRFLPFGVPLTRESISDALVTSQAIRTHGSSVQKMAVNCVAGTID